MFELGVIPPVEQAGVALVLGGELQVADLAGQQLGGGGIFGGVGGDEADPEMVVDDIERDLTATDRAFHEAGQDELGFIKHEAVARVEWQILEGGKGVGGLPGVVTGEFLDGVVRGQEPALNSRHPGGIELQRHVGFGDLGGFGVTQAVIDAVGARVVVGATGGDQFNGFARRCLAAHDLEKALGCFGEIKLADQPVFVNVAGDQLLLEAVAIEQALPVSNLAEDSGGQWGRGRIGSTGFQPLAEGSVFLVVQGRQAKGHAPGGVFCCVIIEPFGADTDLGAAE